MFQAASGRHPSLEWKLIRRLSLLYIVAILGVATIDLVVALINREIESSYQLNDLADALRDFAVRDAKGELELSFPPAFQQKITAIPDFQMAVADAAGGSLVAGGSERLAPLVSGALASWTAAQFSQQVAGRPVQGIVRLVATPVGEIRVVMIRGRPTLSDIVIWVCQEVTFEVLPVILPVMLLTILIGAVTVRRAMAPLKRLSAMAGAIDPRHAGGRLGEDGVPWEVLPLVQAVNRAIGRIELALQQQRRMTANAAHELRTPLAILRARLDGLAECSGQAGLSECPGRAGLDRDVIRLTRLVEQLMAVSRLEAGQVVVDGVIDLVLVAREVLADAAPLAMARGRGVELAAPDHAVMVPGNALALGDALVNLIDNALRYTPEGGTVEVVIDSPMTRSEAGNEAVPHRVMLEVLDRGPGVAEADRAQLFEPFWRGRDQHGKGSGLGLAIVAETIAIHGGTVSAWNRPGGGAIFRVELPTVQKKVPVGSLGGISPR